MHRALTGSAVAMVAAALLVAPDTARPRPGSLWFGPATELAGSVQWIRFQRARLAGEHARAIEIAESALRLTPRSTEGWKLLAAYAALYLGSPEREPALERRRAWLAAGLAITERGAEEARDPGELHLFRALILVGRAEIDPALAPGGPAELLTEAANALSEAEALGNAQAAELLPHVETMRDEALGP